MIIPEFVHSDQSRTAAGVARLRSAPFLANSGIVIAFVSGTVLAALLAIVLSVHATPSSGGLGRALLLAGVAVAYNFLESTVERLRNYMGGRDQFGDVGGVWCFAAAVVLPLDVALGMIVCLYTFFTVRARRSTVRTAAHKTVFNASTVILAIAGAHGVLAIGNSIHRHLHAGAVTAAGLLAAAVCYFVINHVLVTSVVFMAARPERLRDIVMSPSDAMFDFVTLLCGIFAAQMLVSTPWLTPTVLALIVVLHRSALAGQLQHAATTDGRTGLLNAATWQELARRQLLRAEREQRDAAVLLVDLDHFKLVNDVHGHQAGDIALKAVADALKAELRGYDGVGRYGGEEFVAFLDGADETTVRAAAVRITQRIRDLRVELSDGSTLTVTASVGAANFPANGTELDELIAAADVALYAAKAAGRDCVRHSADVNPGTPRTADAP